MNPLILCAVTLGILARPADEIGPLRIERNERSDGVRSNYFRGDHLILRVSEVKIGDKDALLQEAYFGHLDEVAAQIGWRRGEYRECSNMLLGEMELIDFDLDGQFDLMVIRARKKATVPLEVFYLSEDWKLTPVESEVLNEALRLKKVRDADQDDVLFPMPLENIAAGLIARKRGVAAGSSYSIEDMKQWLDQ